jgi:uncharacterized protein YjbI with pentapeptide repeats
MGKDRLTYEESCRKLQDGYLDEGAIPPMPDHRPGPDDEEPLGVCFFRTLVGKGDDLSNLHLPRTFFGRTEIDTVAFRNTNFSESNLCWNDFTGVDFTDAVLADSDMRASLFQGVKFVRTDLRRADLRQSTFKDCVFEGAQMQGAVLTHSQKKMVALSRDQVSEVAWTDDAGEEPPGG